jgi:hypothetical protein
VTAALGVLLILGATALSVTSCARGARAMHRPADVRTLSALLAATVIACAGASIIATNADTVPMVLGFAIGAAGVAAPVVLRLVARPRDDRGNIR